MSVIHPELMQKCCLKLTSLFHNFDHDVMRWQITSCFQSVTKEFEKGVIHHDNNSVFAGVLYLAPNAPKSSGTTLYKTGKDFDQEAYQRALLANDERFKMNQQVDTRYHSMFDEIVRVEIVCNILILYEGHHHHAANEFFGNTRETSRLAQVFFCQRVDSSRESAFPISRVKKIHV